MEYLQEWRKGKTTALFVLGFLGLALWRFGLVYHVEYQRAQVLGVIQSPFGSMNERLVIVKIGPEKRTLHTSDWLLNPVPGQLACVAKRSRFGRRWTLYTLELPGYCHWLWEPKPL